jgi:hypothetical protein
VFEACRPVEGVLVEVEGHGVRSCLLPP